MNKHAVYHRANSNYAYAINEKTLAIRLRTASKDIDEVRMHYENIGKKLKTDGSGERKE